MAEEKELRRAPLSLRIRPSLKAALDELAQSDRRQLAPYVEMVLEAHVEAKAKGKSSSRKRG